MLFELKYNFQVKSFDDINKTGEWRWLILTHISQDLLNLKHPSNLNHQVFFVNLTLSYVSLAFINNHFIILFNLNWFETYIQIPIFNDKIPNNNFLDVFFVGLLVI